MPARSETLTRMERLDLLEAMLRSDEPMTLGAISDELGVSRRTLTRDVELLRDRGLPVEADRGRGGGIRLHRTWGIGRIHLSYQEAIDLLLSIAIAEQMGSEFFMKNLTPLRRKIIATFSNQDQRRIRSVRERILIGRTASLDVQRTLADPDLASLRQVTESFLLMRTARLRYVAGSGAETERWVEPQFLMLNYPVWYLLGWDIAKDAVRTFRCDRVTLAEIGEGKFSARPVSDFRSSIDPDFVINA